MDICKNKNFEFIGPVPKTIRTKTKWKCPIHGIFEMCHDSIKNGCGCRKCSYNAAHTEEDYINICKGRNFTFVGPIPKNAHE